VAKNWKEMSKDERDEYEQLALDDKRRYEAEMKMYRKGGEQDSEVEVPV
jgi:hypothetical protein